MSKSNCKSATDICFEEKIILEKEDKDFWIKQMSFFHSEKLTQKERSLDANSGREDLEEILKPIPCNDVKPQNMLFPKMKKVVQKLGLGLSFLTGGINKACLSTFRKSLKLKIK